MRQSSDAGSQLASLERFPEALNRLFAYRDSRIQHPLISYPRTMQRGYRPGTWERAMNQFLHSQDMEHFKPPYLREYVHEETAHESLHPLELSIQRADLLGYLDQDSLWLYESIHRHHMNAITMPRHPTTESTAGEGVTLSALAHRLSDLKVLRASGLSSAFSRWLGRRWMHLDGRRVVKGSLPEGISEKVSRWVHAWTKVALPELASGDAIHMETVRQALLEVRSS